MTRAEAFAFVAGGTVQAGGGVYLQRRADDELLEHCRAGHFTYILTSRQMGKSSLMIHTAERLSAEGARPVVIDLTEFGAQTTAEQWYKGMLLAIQEQLGLATAAAPWFDQQLHHSLAHRFTRYLREVALAERHERLIVFIDEIDTTLGLGFTDDFFAAIRFLYQNRAADPDLHRLSFVLIGVTTPGDLIKDAARTPFNIGYRIDLTDFTHEEAAALAAPFSLPAAAGSELIARVLGWTGGHPYLTLRVLRSLAESPPPVWTDTTVDERIRDLFLRAGAETDSNLQFVRDMLTRKAFNREAVLRTYGEIRRGERVPDKELDQVGSWLKLSGVVRPSGGALRVRNAIYEHVFDERWAQDHLRLHVNWRRRLTRIAAGLLVLTTLVTIPLAIYAWRQKGEAEYQAQRAALERDDAARQWLITEKSLSERERDLALTQKLLEALSPLAPATAARAANEIAAARTDAEKELAELRANPPPGRAEASPNPPPTRPAPRIDPAPRPPSPAPVEKPAANQAASDDEAVTEVLRKYQAAYGARDLSALKRVQVLPPAAAQTIQTDLTAASTYRLTINHIGIVFSADRQRATVNAAVRKQVVVKGKLTDIYNVTEFRMEKRGSTWVIVKVL
jgi:AAA-like domain